MHPGWSPDEIALRVARDLPAGCCVNLGIGMPTLVASHIDLAGGMLITSENGLIGIGPPPEPGAEDHDTVDAGKNPVTLVQGASVVHHADSFALIRGGRLDIAVLGAFEVSAEGDLASWRQPLQQLGSVGGAMDIAVGARKLFVMMSHRDKVGRPKIVQQSAYPLTAARCVDRIYTDLAVIDVIGGKLVVRDIHPQISFAELQLATGAPLTQLAAEQTAAVEA